MKTKYIWITLVFAIADALVWHIPLWKYLSLQLCMVALVFIGGL